jgi:ABC-type microcin C transport system permease subunit YejB
MLRIILSRLLQTLVVVFLLVTFTFFAIRMMPGNPFADVKALTEENKAAMERLYGLDKPLHIQYANYWKNVLLEGDFGDSFSMKGRKVSTLISESFPISLKLGLLSLLLAMSLGDPPRHHRRPLPQQMAGLYSHDYRHGRDLYRHLRPRPDFPALICQTTQLVKRCRLEPPL